MAVIEATLNDSGIGLLQLNRPERLNALNAELMDAICARLADWATDDRVRALVITGNGRAFCAGADLAADVQQAAPAGSLGEAIDQAMRDRFNPTMMAIYNFPRPVVIAINGIAAGGGVGLALCGDLVLASEKASLKVVQVQQLGIVADLGANWLLQRAIGRPRAMAMCLQGETTRAQQLLEWGAVAEVLPVEQLLPRALECASKLAEVPPGAVLATRRLVDEAPACSFEQSLEQERGVQRSLCDAPHFINQVRAFLG